jgi:hypothetical protein
MTLYPVMMIHPILFSRSVLDEKCEGGVRGEVIVIVYS